jgi:hypothetical protein
MTLNPKELKVLAALAEAVARMAGDFENELRATKLRTTAAARLGDMITEGEEKGVIARHGGNRKAKQDDQDRARNLDPKPATLQEMGVSGRLSARARRLSGIGAKAVAVMLDRMERESRERGVVAHNVIADELGKRNVAPPPRARAGTIRRNGALSIGPQIPRGLCGPGLAPQGRHRRSCL